MLNKMYAKIPKSNLTNESSASITFIMSVSDGWQLFLFLYIVRRQTILSLTLNIVDPIYNDKMKKNVSKCQTIKCNSDVGYRMMEGWKIKENNKYLFRFQRQ